MEKRTVIPLLALTVIVGAASACSAPSPQVTNGSAPVLEQNINGGENPNGSLGEALCEGLFYQQCEGLGYERESPFDVPDVDRGQTLLDFVVDCEYCAGQ